MNTTLAREGRENKSVSYPTFSERGEEDIDDFISELAKAFTVNRVPDNRKHIVVASCLKGIIANFYNRLAGITGWNVAGQAATTQLKSTLKVRFRSEVQVTHYYNQYFILKQGKLMIITYVSNLEDVQTAIDIAKRLEGGLSLTT